MEPLLLLTALTAGFLHAMEADHVAAVTTFVSRRPRPAEAVRFGIRWGIGHSLAILAAGTLLVALGVQFPQGVARGLEFGVGGLLVTLGAWLLWGVLHERAHERTGDAAAPPERAARRGSGWVGIAHGLAGTAPLVALLAAGVAATPGAAAAYLLCFGIGTTAAMALYALAAGALFHQAGRRAPVLGPVLRGATAVGSAVLGMFWMYAAAA
jgi:nickel/cobalt transporter (NicO) family protein